MDGEQRSAYARGEKKVSEILTHAVRVNLAFHHIAEHGLN